MSESLWFHEVDNISLLSAGGPLYPVCRPQIKPSRQWSGAAMWSSGMQRRNRRGKVFSAIEGKPLYPIIVYTSGS